MNGGVGVVTVELPPARILVVDDEPNIAELLSAALTFEGYEVGPLVEPFASGCLQCKLMREVSASDFPIEEELFQQALNAGSVTMPKAENVLTVSMLSSYLAIEVVKFLTRIAVPALLNAVMFHEHLSGSLTRHEFLRVPHCPHCASEMRAMDPSRL